MSTEFDSAGRSQLGFYVESALGVRGHEGVIEVPITGTVADIAVVSATVAFAVGSITEFNGVTVNGIVKYNPKTGAVDEDWVPLTGFANSLRVQVDDFDMVRVLVATAGTLTASTEATVKWIKVDDDTVTLTGTVIDKSNGSGSLELNGFTNDFVWGDFVDTSSDAWFYKIVLTSASTYTSTAYEVTGLMDVGTLRGFHEGANVGTYPIVYLGCRAAAMNTYHSWDGATWTNEGNTSWAFGFGLRLDTGAARNWDGVVPWEVPVASSANALLIGSKTQAKMLVEDRANVDETVEVIDEYTSGTSSPSTSTQWTLDGGESGLANVDVFIPDGDFIWVSGDFDTIDGNTRQRMALVDGSFTVQSFDPGDVVALNQRSSYPNQGAAVNVWNRFISTPGIMHIQEF